jgi:hypothetical protein
MKPETRRRLLETYRPDVKKLERLLKTDLGCWRRPPQPFAEKGP